MYKGPHLADYCTRCSTTVPVHAAMAVRLTSTLLIIYACIRTHGSGSYVGLASWAWFSNERYKTVTKRCLYSPARI